MSYAELHCISNFTFLRGASHPEELVNRATELGYTALALTDECSLAGIVRAHLAARKQKLHLIIGSEFQLHDGMRLVLLATNRDAYGALCQLITLSRRVENQPYRLRRADLESGLEHCLALWLPAQTPHSEQGYWLADCFSQRAWLAVEQHNQGADQDRQATLLRLAEQIKLPALAAGNVHMHKRARRYLQDTLTAIRLRKPLHEAGLQLHSNGERYLRSLTVLQKYYPVTLLQETLNAAGRCRFSLDELRYQYPDEDTPADMSPGAYLRRLTERGKHWRWPQGAPRQVTELIDKELALIDELDYAPYFLTVYDIVAFARKEGILCQGRGSAANSAVCYCLGITEVDPSRMAMLFERFISRERNEPPDIDVDFEHQRREEVLQYIYQKYGRERAALAAAVICYRTRSALRDVGKALGLEPLQIKRLSGLRGWSRQRPLSSERLREAGLDPQAPIIRRLCYLVNELIGFPRHLSQHVGGMVISRGLLCRMVPIENAAMANRTIIQWDKDDLDTLGLLKVDCLALGMLSAIHRAIDLVNHYRGTRLGLASIPAEDPDTYTMIQHADTIGVFQIESRAQMTMLPRLKPACFYDLVIQVAIVRPGPIQGGMVHPYLRRRRSQEPVSYPNSAVKNVLERTLGIPLFQEQMMQLAMVAAGFSAGEADQLRRAMAAWKRQGELAPFRHRLLAGMHRRGYDKDFAEQLYRQIKGFADYGFPESHAASFALLVYVSAWLKCHEPAAFCAALLNSQPMGFYAPAQLVQDARRHGVEIRAVTVNQSNWDCTLEKTAHGQPALRLGFRLVNQLSKKGAERLIAARNRHRFIDIIDLQQRTGLTRRDLKALSTADALRELAGHRHQANWIVSGLDEKTTPLCFGPLVENTPQLNTPDTGAEIVADYASLGFSLQPHPLSLLRRHLHKRRLVDIGKLRQQPNKRIVDCAGLVLNRQRPSTAKGVIFLTLEDETGHLNVIVQAYLARNQRRVLYTAGLLQIRGVIERDGRVVQLLARQLTDLSFLLGRLRTRSRDFR